MSLIPSAEEMVVVPSFTPRELALTFIREFVSTPSGEPGVWTKDGHTICWRGGRWETWSDGRMHHDVCTFLSRCCMRKESNGVRMQKNLAVRMPMVNEVCELILTLSEARWETFPAWGQGGDVLPNPDTCIGFRDKVVSVEGGKICPIDLTPDWIDPFILPVDYDPDGECPRWMRCLDEWSGGDPEWANLLQRWMGYCLMSTRKHHKWLLMFGKVRGGKGTISRVLEALLGQGVVPRDIRGMVHRFGLDGVQEARVLRIGEVHDLDKGRGHEACSILKSIVGGDTIAIDRKYTRAPIRTRVRSAVLAESNELPNIPDNAQGLSSKMLILPFTRSFLGKEQLDLDDELRGELTGIAAWAVEGARQLEAEEDRSKHWPQPAVGVQAKDDYKRITNIFEDFLISRFNVAPGAVCRYDLVLREWEEFKHKNQISDDTSYRWLGHHLRTRTSWDIDSIKKTRDGKTHTFLTNISLKSRHTLGDNW